MLLCSITKTSKDRCIHTENETNEQHHNHWSTMHSDNTAFIKLFCHLMNFPVRKHSGDFNGVVKNNDYYIWRFIVINRMTFSSGIGWAWLSFYVLDPWRNNWSKMNRKWKEAIKRKSVEVPLLEHQNIMSSPRLAAEEMLFDVFLIRQGVKIVPGHCFISSWFPHYSIGFSLY